MKPDDPQFAAVIDGFVEGDHMASVGWATMYCPKCGCQWSTRAYSEYGHTFAQKDCCPECDTEGEWKPEGE